MPKDSLREILDRFKQLDDMEPDAEFDPAELVGDVKDKVDAIKWRIDKWQAEADAIKKDWIDPLTARRKAIESNIDRLKEYCQFYMNQHKFEKLPGNAFELRMQRLAKKLVDCQPADAKFALEFPELVKQKTSYDWDRTKLKEYVETHPDCNFARLQENKCLRFYAKKNSEEKK